MKIVFKILLGIILLNPIACARITDLDLGYRLCQTITKGGDDEKVCQEFVSFEASNSTDFYMALQVCSNRKLNTKGVSAAVHCYTQAAEEIGTEQLNEKIYKCKKESTNDTQAKECIGPLFLSHM